MISYDEDIIKFYSGVLTDLELDDELCNQVAEINAGTGIGGFYLSREGDSGTWCLVYKISVSKRWIDPTSPASAQMIVDIVHNIPEIVNRRVEYLEKHLGSTLQRWTTDESTWWFLLMMHC